MLQPKLKINEISTFSKILVASIDQIELRFIKGGAAEKIENIIYDYGKDETSFFRSQAHLHETYLKLISWQAKDRKSVEDKSIELISMFLREPNAAYKLLNETIYFFNEREFLAVNIGGYTSVRGLYSIILSNLENIKKVWLKRNGGEKLKNHEFNLLDFVENFGMETNYSNSCMRLKIPMDYSANPRYHILEKKLFEK